MKIRFTEKPPGRDEYKVGDVVDFNGPVPEGYARKFVSRGWAVEHKDEPKPDQKPDPKPVEAKSVDAKPEPFSLKKPLGK